jgi:hypothetical protein
MRFIFRVFGLALFLVFSFDTLASLRAQAARGSEQKDELSPAKNEQGVSPSSSLAERLKEIERLAPTYDYTCVMHAEVHQAQEGSCPTCGMPLKPLTPGFKGAYQLAFATMPKRPQTGAKMRLRLQVLHPETGARVRDFVLNHEKLFHLFLISQDMEEYQHLHPQLERDGSFMIETTLTRAGQYHLHADFFPVGGTLQVLHHKFLTANNRNLATSAPAQLTPDVVMVKTVQGTRIELKPSGAFTVGKLIPLRFHLTDVATGQAVRDLEPYLGAWGHTLILNADQSEYLHSHPTEMLPDNTDGKTVRGGPIVEFQALFPAPGMYRIWTQFQRVGQVFTVSFTVQVQNP